MSLLLKDVVLSGSPTAPTPATGDASTKVATTAFAQAATAAQLAPIANTRGPRQALVFDGTAAADVNIPGPGLGDFTFSFDFALRSIGGGLTSCFTGGPTGGVVLGIQGGVVIYLNGAPAPTLTGATPILAHVRYSVTYARIAGTGYMYINGVLDGTAADANNYGSAVTKIGGLIGALYVDGIISKALAYNYGLNSTQVVRLFATGVPDAVDISGATTDYLGSATWANNANTDFDWDTFLASGRGFSGTQGTSYRAYSWLIPSAIRYLKKGTRVHIKAHVVIGATSSLKLSLAGDASFWDGLNCKVFSEAGTFDYDATWTVTTDGWIAALCADGSGTVDLTSVYYDILGATVCPDSHWLGLGNYWPDTSGNGAHLVLTPGVQSLIKSVRGEVGNNVYAFAGPVLEAVIAAGRSYTTGDIFAELTLPLGQMAFGDWLVTAEGSAAYGGTIGASRWVGGGSAPGYDRIDPVSRISIAGVNGGDGLCADLSVVAADSNTTTRVRLIASFSSTATETLTMRLYHLSGVLDRRFVK